MGNHGESLEMVGEMWGMVEEAKEWLGIVDNGGECWGIVGKGVKSCRILGNCGQWWVMIRNYG